MRTRFNFIFQAQTNPFSISVIPPPHLFGLEHVPSKFAQKIIRKLLPIGSYHSKEKTVPCRLLEVFVKNSYSAKFSAVFPLGWRLLQFYFWLFLVLWDSACFTSFNFFFLFPTTQIFSPKLSIFLYYFQGKILFDNKLRVKIFSFFFFEQPAVYRTFKLRTRFKTFIESDKHRFPIKITFVSG